jgi:hypothetical protein
MRLADVCFWGKADITHGRHSRLFAAAFFVWSGTIAQLRHTFLFSAVSATKDCIVLFNPVADNMRAAMRTSRCEVWIAHSKLSKV